jgi:hypothetical protein
MMHRGAPRNSQGKGHDEKLTHQFGSSLTKEATVKHKQGSGILMTAVLFHHMLGVTHPDVDDLPE